MKLRAAIGESGRAPSPFASKRTWASTSGDDRQAAVILAELGNEDVGPERTKEIEGGFEASMFSGRFSIDFTFYDQSTFDALLRLARPASIGTEQSLLTNLGEVENNGCPKKYDGVEINYKEHTKDKLPLSKSPLPVTVYKVGNNLLVDPDRDEQEAYDARLTVTATDGNLCALQKGGESPLKVEEIKAMVELAMKKADELRKYL